MPHLGVIFVQYDQVRYANAFPALLACLARLVSWDVKIIRVDNAHEGEWLRQITPQLLEAGGDNRLFEFSAWERGRQALEQQWGACELYLCVTDAFQAYGEAYEPLVSDDLPEFLRREAAVAGLIDFFPEMPRDMRLGDWNLTCWVRSSFFWLPREVWVKQGALGTFNDMRPFCAEEYQGQAFLANAPLSRSYQAYLVQWLTRDWHSAFVLGQATWSKFRYKVRSILNEHAMTARWKEAQVPLYDLRFLQVCRQGSLKPLTLVSESELKPYRFSPEAQHQILKPSFSKRLGLQLRRIWRNHSL